MKTTIDIPDSVLKEAMSHAKSGKKRDAVLAALEEYNRRHRQAEAVKFLGTFKDFITLDELIEAREARGLRHHKQRKGNKWS